MDSLRFTDVSLARRTHCVSLIADSSCINEFATAAYPAEQQAAQENLGLCNQREVTML